MTDSHISTPAHTRFLVALCLCLALVTGLRLAYVPLTPNGDYTSYIDTAQLFSGVPTTLYAQRVLKPLGPLVIAALTPFTSPLHAFLIEVVVFYFAFAIAFYFLAYEFFENRTAALFAALLGAVSYPMLRYGLDLYTETGAHFFYVLALFYMLRYLKAPSNTKLVTAGLVIGVGLLWKEYSVVAGFGFGLMLLFEAIPLIKKAKNLLILAVTSLLPAVLVQAIVIAKYHYSYLDWYKQGGVGGFATQYTVTNLTKSLAALLGLGWFFVPTGALQIHKEYSFGTPKYNFILFSTIATFLALGWGFVSSRLFFVMAIPFILIAVAGIRKLPQRVQILSVFVIILANIAWLCVAAKAHL